MKPTMLLMITIFLIFPAISQAESPFSSLQSAKEKTTVLQDLRKICTPQASLSDEAWEKLMLSDKSKLSGKGHKDGDHPGHHSRTL